MVYRFVRTSNLKEVGLVFSELDCFTAECFGIIQCEIDRQRSLKEKHG